MESFSDFNKHFISYIWRANSPNYIIFKKISLSKIILINLSMKMLIIQWQDQFFEATSILRIINDMPF